MRKAIIIVICLIFMLSGCSVEQKEKIKEISFTEILSEAMGDDIYDEYAKAGIVEIGSDDSFLIIDTWPSDLTIEEVKKFTDVNKVIKLRDDLEKSTNVIKELNRIMGFPEYVFEEMQATTRFDGKQVAQSEKYEVMYKYHPDDGLEVMYKRIES